MSYNNGPHFVATWTTRFSAAADRRINRAIQQIDPDAEFVRHDAAGKSIHAWIERPNDGTNDHNDVRARNKQLVAIVAAEAQKQRRKGE